jgi:hypothetical protein
VKIDRKKYEEHGILIDRQPDRSPVRPNRLLDRSVKAVGQDNPGFIPEMQLSRSRENLGIPNR